jgi:hypothetical protein
MLNRFILSSGVDIWFLYNTPLLQLIRRTFDTLTPLFLLQSSVIPCMEKTKKRFGFKLKGLITLKRSCWTCWNPQKSSKD